MDKILQETLDFIRETQGKTGIKPESITLPRTRLTEFVSAAANPGLPKTIEEIERVRQDALDGKAMCWGVPIRFVPDDHV